MQKEAQKIMSPGLDHGVNPQSEDAVGLICHPKVVVGGERSSNFRIFGTSWTGEHARRRAPSLNHASSP